MYVRVIRMASYPDGKECRPTLDLYVINTERKATVQLATVSDGQVSVSDLKVSLHHWWKAISHSDTGDIPTFTLSATG